MIHVFNDVVWFLTICTDHCAELAQRCARSSALFLPTVTLHVARILNRYDEVCDIIPICQTVVIIQPSTKNNKNCGQK